MSSELEKKVTACIYSILSWLEGQIGARLSEKELGHGKPTSSDTTVPVDERLKEATMGYLDNKVIERSTSWRRFCRLNAPAHDEEMSL